jgi:hypothetical protein
MKKKNNKDYQRMLLVDMILTEDHGYSKEELNIIIEVLKKELRVGFG